MPEMTHPNLPDQPITVGDRQVANAERAGWVVSDPTVSQAESTAGSAPSGRTTTPPPPDAGENKED